MKLGICASVWQVHEAFNIRDVRRPGLCEYGFHICRLDLLLDQHPVLPTSKPGCCSEHVVQNLHVLEKVGCDHRCLVHEADWVQLELRIEHLHAKELRSLPERITCLAL